jgi:hypothetical protein
MNHESGHAEGISPSFLECGDNLLLFVAVRVHQGALYILKNEAEGSVGFGKVKMSPHGCEDVSRLVARPNGQILVSHYAMHL